MRLISVVLKNFRPYRDEVRIPVNDFTAFVGRNDVGKSCILESLDIFFNGTELDTDDRTRPHDHHAVTIGCVFADLPEELTLDTHSRTTLLQEHLLNADGHLEILKTWDCSGAKPKQSTWARARHPTATNAEDLLTLKQAQLKKRISDLGISTENIDLRSNPAMRKAICDSLGDLHLEGTLIPLDKDEGKAIWTKLEEYLPVYALFKADRPSRDEDQEIQDPMKIAVKEALASLAPALEDIKQKIRTQATEVAARTLAKLKEFDSTLAQELTPHFRADPKWDSLFKLSLTGDHDIPINKRGSGVRRLILLSFFRAEAERRRDGAVTNQVIYAVEEPETSQHPVNQRLIIKTLLQLAEQDCQILITTHNPALAGLVPIEDVRHVTRSANGVVVDVANETVLERIVAELGVHPDNRVKVIVCVEGPNDFECFGRLSEILHAEDPTIPNLRTDQRVAMVPVGGSNISQWVQNRYLRGLGRPEVHWYDRDDETPPVHQQTADKVNARADGSLARVSDKRELENYLHPDAIVQAIGHEVVISDTNDVPALVAAALHAADPAHVGEWDELDSEKKRFKIRRAKHRLNREAADKMTAGLLSVSDPSNEIRSWLGEIGKRLV